MMAGKGEGISITAYTSGHMVGGSNWKIAKESDEIIYAVDNNHRRERHLNPSLLPTLVKYEM